MGSSDKSHKVWAWVFHKFGLFLKDSDSFFLENYIGSNCQAQPMLEIAVKVSYSNLLGNS